MRRAGNHISASRGTAGVQTFDKHQADSTFWVEARALQLRCFSAKSTDWQIHCHDRARKQDLKGIYFTRRLYSTSKPLPGESRGTPPPPYFVYPASMVPRSHLVTTYEQKPMPSGYTRASRLSVAISLDGVSKHQRQCERISMSSFCSLYPRTFELPNASFTDRRTCTDTNTLSHYEIYFHTLYAKKTD